MSEAEVFVRKHAPENMPPTFLDPVLQDAYERLHIQEFREEFAIKTPVDDEGLVDHETLVAQVADFVEPGYKWKTPFFDEHHLYWPHASYNKDLEGVPRLYHEFRELPVHKIWVPRQFHNFIHTMSLPPEVPDDNVMKREVRAYRRKDYLLRLTKRIIDIQQVSERAQPYVFRENGVDKIRYMDTTTRRVIDDLERLDSYREGFIRQLETHHRKGLIDLEQLSSLSIEEVGASGAIEDIRASLMSKMVRRKFGRQALKVALPFEKVA